MYYMKHNQLTKLYPATHGRWSSGDSINALNHSTSGVGSSITSDACETSQSLLAGVSDVFLGIILFFLVFFGFFNVREIKLKQTLYILYKQ